MCAAGRDGPVEAIMRPALQRVSAGGCRACSSASGDFGVTERDVAVGTAQPEVVDDLFGQQQSQVVRQAKPEQFVDALDREDVLADQGTHDQSFVLGAARDVFQLIQHGNESRLPNRRQVCTELKRRLDGRRVYPDAELHDLVDEFSDMLLVLLRRHVVVRRHGRGLAPVDVHGLALGVELRHRGERLGGHGGDLLPVDAGEDVAIVHCQFAQLRVDLREKFLGLARLQCGLLEGQDQAGSDGLRVSDVAQSGEGSTAEVALRVHFEDGVRERQKDTDVVGGYGHE